MKLSPNEPSDATAYKRRRVSPVTHATTYHLVRRRRSLSKDPLRGRRSGRSIPGSSNETSTPGRIGSIEDLFSVSRPDRGTSRCHRPRFNSTNEWGVGPWRPNGSVSSLNWGIRRCFSLLNCFSCILRSTTAFRILDYYIHSFVSFFSIYLYHHSLQYASSASTRYSRARLAGLGELLHLPSWLLLRSPRP